MLKKILPIVFPLLLFLILLQNSVFAAQIKVKFKVDGIT
jgi:hypothetical protein